MASFPQEDAPLPILIIGAGLGGLCLAQGLKKAHIPFRLFERDPTPPGARRAIDSASRATVRQLCSAALQQSLAPELWTYFQRTCWKTELGETDIDAISGTVQAYRADKSPALRGMVAYTCDRGVLRDILLTGLEDSISFGKVFLRYSLNSSSSSSSSSSSDEASVTAHFADGTSATGTLLVGADGGRSPVRKQFLPDHKPLDNDGVCIYGKTLMSPELLAKFPQKALRWMTLVTDRTPMTQTLDIDDTPVTLLLEPIRFPEGDYRGKLPADYMYWVPVARKAAFGMSDTELVKLSGEQAAKLSLQVREYWDPAIRILLELQDTEQSSPLRIASANPDIPAWEPSATVTLIDDAIHVMSPCGGVGAVTALRDGANLAAALVDGGVKGVSVRVYEEGMREYAEWEYGGVILGGGKSLGRGHLSSVKSWRIISAGRSRGWCF